VVRVLDSQLDGCEFDSQPPRCRVTTLSKLLIYSLGHRLHALTTVPRSTQPSTLCEILNWVSSFGLSYNNKWRWWVWMVTAIGRLTAQVGWLGLRIDGHPVLSLHSSDEPGELSQWLWSWWQQHKYCGIIIIIIKNTCSFISTGHYYHCNL